MENRATHKPWKRYNIIKIPLTQGSPSLLYNISIDLIFQKKKKKKEPCLISVMQLKTSIPFQRIVLFLRAAITRCKNFSHLLIVPAINYEKT